MDADRPRRKWRGGEIALVILAGIATVAAAKAAQAFLIPLTAALLFLQGISELMKNLWAARTGVMFAHHDRIEI